MRPFHAPSPHLWNGGNARTCHKSAVGVTGAQAYGSGPSTQPAWCAVGQQAGVGGGGAGAVPSGQLRPGLQGAGAARTVMCGGGGAAPEPGQGAAGRASGARGDLPRLCRAPALSGVSPRSSWSSLKIQVWGVREGPRKN